MIIKHHLNKQIVNKLQLFFAILGALVAALLSVLLNYYFLSSNLVHSTLIGTLYVAILIWIMVFMFADIQITLIKKPLNLYLVFYCTYYLLGILPISNYRGYIDQNFWLQLSILGAISLIVGWSFEKVLRKGTYSNGRFHSEFKLRKLPILLILLSSTLSTIYILGSYGFIFLNPTLRFNVGSVPLYLVELSVPTTIVYLAFTLNKESLNKKDKISIIAIVLLSFILLLSLGYRNQPMLLILSLLIILLITKVPVNRIMSLKFRIVAATAISFIFVLFSMMFLIRIEQSDRLLNWDRLSEVYSIKNPQIAASVVPLHMSAREGIGVSEYAVQRSSEIEQYSSLHSFFFLDVLTLLPGKQPTAGQVLGVVVNRDDTVSLTPSIIGALFISFGYLGVIAFFVITGIILSFFWHSYKKGGNPSFLAYLVTLMVYLIEFTNRGVFKPMYLIIFIIVHVLIKVSVIKKI